MRLILAVSSFPSVKFVINKKYSPGLHMPPIALLLGEAIYARPNAEDCFDLNV